MVKPQLPARQRIRKVLIMLAFLSFPVTMNYLSPYVIIEGAANGIVNGSLVMFGLLFASALFLGRAWCGWICPGGAMQELALHVARNIDAADHLRSRFLDHGFSGFHCLRPLWDAH